jgi:AcrR family transcriptional regulator
LRPDLASAGLRIAAGGWPVALEEQPRRQRRPHEKLGRLIASATRVFGSEGYARARIQAICREAGVSVGTFYDHFENKADLMLRVAEQSIDRLPVPDAATLREFEEHVAALAAAPTAGVARAWIEAIHIEPELSLANARIRGIFFARYKEWVADARARRHVHAALDDEATARAVMALVKEAVTGTHEPPGVRVRDMAHVIWFLLYAE